MELFKQTDLKGLFQVFWDRYWSRASVSDRGKLLVYLTAAISGVYVLTPTLFPRNADMLSKSQRPDRYTTGLINMSIDCFANSTLQSLLSLPGLNEYLNELCTKIYNNQELWQSYTPPSLPLHEALIGILMDLQKIIYKSKTLSVWDFLNVLERIFKSKISRNQHDAHELLQLILETLSQENLNLYKYSIRSGMSKNVDIPQLPFRSLYLDQLHCTVCGGDSNLNFNPMMILTLPVPQESSIDLSRLIKKNENELIEGYSCIKCKINAIINLETQKRSISDEDLQKLKTLMENENLMINDDLPLDLNAIVQRYAPANGFKIDSVKTTITKRNNIVKPPKILPIHLSRSIFANTQELRNSCQVLFPQELVLETDVNLASQLQKIEEEKILSDFDKQELEPIQEEEFLKPSILKEDTEKQEDEFYEDVGQNSDIDDDNNSLDEEDSPEIGEEDDEDVEDDEDEEQPVFKKNYGETPASNAVYNNLSETSTFVDSTDPASAGVSTVKHRYVLRSMIRHQGTHQAGHYECYRRKPDFYKTASDEFEIKFPFLVNSGGNDEDSQVPESAISDSQTTDPETTKMSRSSSMNKSRSESITMSRSGSVLSAPEDQSVLSRSSSRKKSRSFSRRLSSLLTPGNTMDSLTSRTDELAIDDKPKRKKKKRLGSFIKYPFWRISDSKITEAKVDDVLNDNKAVYMLFYERVEPS